jgi:hypothetical protein
MNTTTKPTQYILYFRRSISPTTIANCKAMLEGLHSSFPPEIVTEMNEHFSYFVDKERISTRVMSRFTGDTIARFNSRLTIGTDAIRDMVAWRFDNASWSSMKPSKRSVATAPAKAEFTFVPVPFPIEHNDSFVTKVQKWAKTLWNRAF